MSQSRRDFLKNSGMVIMAGAAGFLGAEQFLRADEMKLKFGDGVYNGATPSSSASGGGGVTGDGRPRADRKQMPTLITIFLRGGADSLNAFVPVGDPLYTKYRPRIALPVNQKKGEPGVIKLPKSDYWGLNNRLAPLMPLFDQGLCVPILNVGSTDDTRSHFSAQDYMERAAPGNTAVTHGWLNRYLEMSRKAFDAPLRGLSAQSLVPRALRGAYPVLAGNNHTEQMSLFEELYSPKNLVNMTARDGATDDKGSRLDERFRDKMPVRALTSDQTRDIITQSASAAVERIRALDMASSMSNDADYPNGPLSHQLQSIAKVIKADVGLEVAQADYGGWDHHSDQGGPNGRHSQMLGHLADCLVAFRTDMGKRMDKVMVLVMSEFGRTVHENGSLGTDHGRAGFMLAMSDSLNGGKFYGTWNGLEDLEGGRFQPVHTDFRTVFAESLARLFHFDPYTTNIFPGYKGTPSNLLGFMKQVKEV